MIKHCTFEIDKKNFWRITVFPLHDRERKEMQYGSKIGSGKITLSLTSLKRMELVSN